MKLMDSEQVQKQLSISRSTLYSWVKQGKLTARRAGHAMLFEEDEIMRAIGVEASTSVHFASGPLDRARTCVRQRPHATVEYISRMPGIIRAKLVRDAGGNPLTHIHGMTYEALSNARKNNDFFFLGADPDAAWRLDLIHDEISPSGVPYIALDFVRCDSESEKSEHEKAVDQLIAAMNSTPFTLPMEKFNRDECYERQPR